MIVAVEDRADLVFEQKLVDRRVLARAFLFERLRARQGTTVTVRLP